MKKLNKVCPENYSSIHRNMVSRQDSPHQIGHLKIKCIELFGTEGFKGTKSHYTDAGAHLGKGHMDPCQGWR